MQKSIVIFTFFLVFLFSSLFSYVLAEYNVVASAEEIRGYDAHVREAREFWNIFNANFESIRTWQGQVNVVKKTWFAKDKAKLRWRFEYDVDFNTDLVEHNYRYVSTGKYCVSYRSGERIPTRLSREAMISQQDSSSNVLFSIYTSYHYMDEVPEEKRTKYASTLTLSTDFRPSKMFFNPIFHGLPGAGVEGFHSIFDILDLDKLAQKDREQGKDDHEIREHAAFIREHGFPEIWKLSKKGNELYFDSLRGHNTWDLSRGAWPILYTTSDSSWTCELRQVSNIWIPQKITIESENSDGSFSLEEITWTRQKINEPIDDKLWTTASLGVRQGDLGVDARTNTSFIVSGDEFLPSQEQEEATTAFNKSRNKWTLFRIFAMFCGLSLVVIAFYIRTTNNRHKNSNNGVL